MPELVKINFQRYQPINQDFHATANPGATETDGDFYETKNPINTAIRYNRLGQEKSTFLTFQSFDVLRKKQDLEIERRSHIQRIKENPAYYKELPKKWKDDHRLASAALFAAFPDKKELNQLCFNPSKDKYKLLEEPHIFLLIAANSYCDSSSYLFKVLRRRYPLYKENEDFIKRAVSLDGEIYLEIPKKFKYKREILEAAVNSEINPGIAYEFIPYNSKHRKDKELALEAIKFAYASEHNNSIFNRLRDEHLKDRDFVLEGVKRNPLLYMKLVKDENPLKDDKEILYYANLLRRQINTLAFFLDDPLTNPIKKLSYKKHPELYLAVAQNEASIFGVNLMSHNTWLKSDREFLLEAIERGTEIPPYISRRLAHDEKFVTEAKNRNWKLASDAEAIKMIRTQDPALIKDLEKFSIASPRRLKNLKLARKIVNMRKKLSLEGPKSNLIDPSKPSCVYIGAKDDHNGGLSFSRLEDYKDYNIFYFEVDKKQDIVEAFNELRWYLDKYDKKIDSLYLAGHSSQRSMTLGKENLSVNDYEWLNDLGLSHYLNQDPRDPSIISIQGCSTGARGKYKNNIASMFARLFPNSEIYAALENGQLINNLEDGRGKLIPYYSVPSIDIKPSSSVLKKHARRRRIPA